MDVRCTRTRWSSKAISQKGVSELKPLVEQQIELLGPDHFDVRANSGSPRQRVAGPGDPLTAIDSFRRDCARDGFGWRAANCGRGRCHFAVGRALAAARRYDEAAKELNVTNAILAATLGPDDLDVRGAAGVTGFVLTRNGRLGEADAVFARLLSRPFSQPLEEAYTKLRLGILRSAQGRHAEAQALSRDAAAFFSSSPLATNHAVTLAALGEAQIEAGLATEALDVLE